MNRRKFVRHSLVAAGAATAAVTLKGKGMGKSPGSAGMHCEPAVAAATARRPLSAVGGFTFARLRYASGNWDADPKMPSNLLNSLVEYTSVRVDPNERILDVSSPNIADYP